MNKVMISIAAAGALIAAGIALLVHRKHKTDYQSIDNILSKNKTGEKVSINFFTKTGGLGNCMLCFECGCFEKE